MYIYTVNKKRCTGEKGSYVRCERNLLGFRVQGSQLHGSASSGKKPLIYETEHREKIIH